MLQFTREPGKRVSSVSREAFVLSLKRSNDKRGLNRYFVSTAHEYTQQLEARVLELEERVRELRWSETKCLKMPVDYLIFLDVKT